MKNKRMCEQARKEEREQALASFLKRQDRKDKWATRFGKLLKPLKILALVLSAIFILYLAAYVISCIPKSVCVEYDGIQYRRSEPETVEPVHIRIDGKVTHKLFHLREFKGIVEVSNADVSINNPISIFLTSFGEEEQLMGSMTYLNPWGRSVSLLYSYGILWTDPSFSYTVFNLWEPADENTRVTNDLVITAPVQTVAEGELLITEHELPIQSTP